MTLVPLGQREGAKLEFKGRDALKKPASIGREVVAMLNAEGGEIWIGVTEQEGRAVAIEPLENLEQARSALQDHLIDTIEPTPISGEIVVEQQTGAEGGLLLRVLVRPNAARGPYAQRNREGRLFVKRVEDRTRPMSRDEIFSRGGQTADQVESARQRIRTERKDIRECLWLFIKPVPPVELDLQKPEFRDYLTDPARTGNRLHGWTFALTSEPVQRKEDRLVSEIKGYRRTEIRQDGTISFALPLEGLHWKGSGKEIWPFALLEYPVSLFRLAQTVYKMLPPGKAILADLALLGIEGWTLRPYSPYAFGYLTESARSVEDKDFVLEEPLLFAWDEVIAKPDSCAFRLIARVYDAFRYTRELIPQEFDQRVGRLAIPE